MFKGAKMYRRLSKRPSTELATTDRLAVSTRAAGDRCALDAEGGGVKSDEIEAGEAGAAESALFGVSEASAATGVADEAAAEATIFGDCDASAALREAKKAFGSISSRICSENSGPWSPEPNPKLPGAASQ